MSKTDQKSKAAGEKDDEKGKNAASLGLPDTEVRKFASSIKSEMAKMDKHRGEIGQFMKQFEEKGGHKKAFKLAIYLDDLETVDVQDFLRSLQFYMDALGTTKRIEAQGDLVDEAAKMPKVPPKTPEAPAASATH